MLVTPISSGYVYVLVTPMSSGYVSVVSDINECSVYVSVLVTSMSVVVMFLL